MRSFKPDVLVVATGSSPIVPMPGIDRKCNNSYFLLKMVKNGQNIVIVGGGLVGCETGLHLAQKGKNVQS